MDYLLFSAWFTLAHIVTYTLAGVLALRISSDLYRGPDRHLDYLRDMADENDYAWVAKYSLFAQLPRGLLMSLVLYPILGPLGQLGFWPQFFFFFGLMFIYSDLSSATPFPGNLEGVVYLRDRYRKGRLNWKLHFENGLYSLLFAFAASVWVI